MIIFKEATKSYFMYFSCVVIILFDTGLYRSAFTIITFEKLVFHFSMLSGIFVLDQMF